MVKFQKFKAFRQNKNLDNNYRSLVIEYDDQQGSPKIKMIDTNNRFVLRTQSLSSPSVSNRNQLIPLYKNWKFEWKIPLWNEQVGDK